MFGFAVGCNDVDTLPQKGRPCVTKDSNHHNIDDYLLRLHLASMNVSYRDKQLECKCEGFEGRRISKDTVILYKGHKPARRHASDIIRRHSLDNYKNCLVGYGGISSERPLQDVKPRKCCRSESFCVRKTSSSKREPSQLLLTGISSIDKSHKRSATLEVPTKTTACGSVTSNTSSTGKSSDSLIPCSKNRLLNDLVIPERESVSGEAIHGGVVSGGRYSRRCSEWDFITQSTVYYRDTTSSTGISITSQPSLGYSHSGFNVPSCLCGGAFGTVSGDDVTFSHCESGGCGGNDCLNVSTGVCCYQGEENTLRFEENGEVVVVSEHRVLDGGNRKGHIIIRVSLWVLV